MSFGLCWSMCCEYGGCDWTVCIFGCGVHLSGIGVQLLGNESDGFAVLDTKTTDDSGCVTFPIAASGTYGLRAIPPRPYSPWAGFEEFDIPIFCPNPYLGNTERIDLQPPEGSECTTCGPVAQPANLTLSLPGFGLSPATTNGFRWVIDWPIVDCPDNGCPAPPDNPGSVLTTRIFFQLYCNPTDGYYYLTMGWVTRGSLFSFHNPHHLENIFDVFEQCPYPWDDHTVFPVGGGGANVDVAFGGWKSSVIAGSGSFFVLFDPIFYRGGGGGSTVADPFRTLLCTTGSFTPTVSAT